PSSSWQAAARFISRAKGSGGRVPPVTTTTGAEDVRWDLGRLYPAADDPALEGDLEAALGRAKDVSARLHGKVAELDPAGLSAAVDELQDIQERVEKVGAFAYLNFVTDTSDP